MIGGHAGDERDTAGSNGRVSAMVAERAALATGAFEVPAPRRLRLAPAPLAEMLTDGRHPISSPDPRRTRAPHQRDFCQSRRPDSNRGPLHYESLPSHSARFAKIPNGRFCWPSRSPAFSQIRQGRCQFRCQFHSARSAYAARPRRRGATKPGASVGCLGLISVKQGPVHAVSARLPARTPAVPPCAAGASIRITGRLASASGV